LSLSLREFCYDGLSGIVLLDDMRRWNRHEIECAWRQQDGRGPSFPPVSQFVYFYIWNKNTDNGYTLKKLSGTAKIPWSKRERVSFNIFWPRTKRNWTESKFSRRSLVRPGAESPETSRVPSQKHTDQISFDWNFQQITLTHHNSFCLVASCRNKNHTLHLITTVMSAASSSKAAAAVWKMSESICWIV
jgi:hypothetical protein